MLNISVGWTHISPLVLIGQAEVGGAPADIIVSRTGRSEDVYHSILEICAHPTGKSPNLNKKKTYNLPPTLTPFVGKDVVLNGIDSHTILRKSLVEYGDHFVLTLHARFDTEETDRLFSDAGQDVWGEIYSILTASSNGADE